MHSYGLFNGRYGLSDKIFIDDVPAEHRAAVEEMLRGELDRQERLIDSLHLDHEYALLINEARLFHNYKLLEFFDTLALYFQMTHPQERKISEFTNVPRAVGDDITVTITPLKSGAYALAPYPFRQESMTFSYGGRYLSAQEPGANMRQLWNTAQSYSEPIQIVRG